MAAATPATADTEPLLPGLGSHHHAISTTSPLAQLYFDQGLRLIYAFNHDEARRSFEQAARLDPHAAMPRWGIALALGPNINNRMVDAAREKAAFAAIQAARALAGGATPIERAYIEALSARYSAVPTHHRSALDRAYADAMRDLTRRFPDDLDAATLFAEALMDLHPWDLWTREGEPGPDTPEIVATLEAVLARAPEHPGANHYYIHAVEASSHPEKALPSAERLPGLMPGAGHLAHMPAHIYIRLGRYAEASHATEAGALIDRKYLDTHGSDGFYALMYYPHGLQFLSMTASMEARAMKAIESAWAASAAVPDAALREMPMLEGFRATPFFALARFGRWTDILAAPAPPPEQRFAHGIYHYARGLALARTGDTGGSARELEALEAIRAATPGGTRVGFNRAAPLLQIGTLVLSGEIALARGRANEAIADLRRAAAIEDTLSYGEPPDWPVPVRHHLGAALLAANRPEEAEAVYLEDLRVNRENGWALLGLLQSLRAQHRSDEAATVARRLAAAWPHTDVAPRGSRF
jgi:tetratricopeptide (TPR) repeat protein